jgi:hypothetical protein
MGIRSFSSVICLMFTRLIWFLTINVMTSRNIVSCSAIFICQLKYQSAMFLFSYLLNMYTEGKGIPVFK